MQINEVQKLVFTAVPAAQSIALRATGGSQSFAFNATTSNAALKAGIEALPEYSGRTVTVTGTLTESGGNYSGTLTLTFDGGANVPQLEARTTQGFNVAFDGVDGARSIQFKDAAGADLGAPVSITPGDAAATVQAAVRALGVPYAAAMVTGSTTALGGANILTGGTASASSFRPDYSADRATDGVTDADTGWVSSGVPAWWKYDLGDGNETVATRLTIYAAMNFVSGLPEGNPESFTIEGSNDNTLWTTLGTQTGIAWTDSTTKNFDFSNATAYQYYRINISSVTGSLNATLLEVEMSNATPSTGSYLIDTQTLSPIPLPTAAGANVVVTETQQGGAPAPGITAETTTEGQTMKTFTIDTATDALIPLPTNGDSDVTISYAQVGSDGSSSLVDPLPILPDHIALYRADTLAEIEAMDDADFVGTADELDFNLDSLRDPRFPHNRSLTYDHHADKRPTVTLAVTLPTDNDENGDNTEHCSRMEEGVYPDGSTRYISKPQWFRIACVSPVAPYVTYIDFYGSAGKAIPRSYNEEVEEIKFEFDLLENPSGDFSLRAITKSPTA